MSRNRQKPERIPTAGSPVFEYTETHPAYAMIGASRVSSNPGEALFGSDFLHQHYVVIRVRPAELRRGLSEDYIGGSRLPYVEVAMSEAQWATFVSSMNVGDGVGASLQWEHTQGEVPAIDPITDRREQLRHDVDRHLAGAIADIRERVQSSSMGAKQKFDLLARIDNLIPNLGFTAQQFDEHAERTIERAKIEVNAYVTAAIHRAGVAALAGENTGTLLELAEPEAPMG